MITKENTKTVITVVLITALFALAIVIIKPIAISILFGILFAYIFYPLYKWVKSKIKNETLSALIVCVGILIILGILLILLIGSLLSQVINFYSSLEKLDLIEIINQVFPNFLSSSELSRTIASSLNTFISDFLADALSNIGDIILDIPIILLQLFVVIFIFFYALRDGEKAIDYLKSLSPLQKETQEKFFKQFKDITYSVLIGEIAVGIIQGIISGIGYFVFGVPNTLLLTLLTIVVSILPLIGPWLIWVPVNIYLFTSGRTEAGIGLLIYGLLIISWLDTVIRSMIVSRRAEINSAIVIIGMLGGVFVFGILGFIIGPLVLGYVLLVIELYRKKTLDETIIFKKPE